MIRRFDAWLGLKLFHPLIIRLCQATGYTQHQLHRDGWFVFFMIGLYGAVRGGEADWVRITFLVILCVAMFLRAALTSPTSPGRSALWLRMVILGVFVIIDVPTAVFLGEPRLMIQALIVLFAEYATTIVNIPPRKPKEKRASRAKESTT